MATVLWSKMGDTEKAEEYHEKALKILEAEPESVELASLYGDMAERVSMGRTGDLAEARSWAEKALKLAKKLNAHEVIARSYACLGEIWGWLGDPQKFREYIERALKIALENNYIETALFAYNDLGAFPAFPMHACMHEDNEKNLEYYEKGLELAKKVGDIFWISWIGTQLTGVYIGKGNMNKAMAFADESLVLDRKAGNLNHLPISLVVLGFVYQVMGEWDKTEQYYQEALSISQRLDQFQQIASSCLHRGWLHFDRREYSKARECFERGYEIFERRGAKYKQMAFSDLLIWTYIELGEIEKAKNLIDSLHKFALEVKYKALIATADALRAMLFRTQKKWKESIDYFEKSLQEFEALDARRWSIYWFAKMVLCEYARVHLERDQKGDREKARNLLNQALEIFQKMGAKKDIERTRSKLAYLETGREMVEPEPVAEVSLPSHITTGYKELDDLLFGGIPRNYAVILTSPSCDERDLLIRKFLEAGAKDGQITFHIITKATGTQKLAELFQSNYSLFICNPEADAIIKSLPNVYKLKGVENLTDINIALTSAFRKLGKSPKGPRRACIEIVSDVLLQHHAVQTRRWLNALIPKLKSKGFTTLAVMDPEMHASQEVRAILDLFDGEISIYKKATEKGRFLKIEKMTDQKYLESELHLRKGKLQR